MGGVVNRSRLYCISIFLYWMMNWLSRGHLFDDLLSSGSKIMMRGLTVHQLCVGRYTRTNIDDR